VERRKLLKGVEDGGECARRRGQGSEDELFVLRRIEDEEPEQEPQEARD